MKIKITFFTLALFFAPVLTFAYQTPSAVPNWDVSYFLNGTVVADGATITIPLNTPLSASYTYGNGSAREVYAEIFKGTLHNVELDENGDPKIFNSRELTSNPFDTEDVFDEPGQYFAVIYEKQETDWGGDMFVTFNQGYPDRWLSFPVDDADGIGNYYAPPLWGIVNFTIDEVINMPSLANGGETENDGIPDTKGVANKTEFTFNVLYTGTTAPSDATLWTNANDTTKSYALTLSATTTNDGDFQNGEWYAFTGTFPQGKYGYHFEANDGGARFPTEGELKFTTGYSNVAFLPGIKASRLFKYDCGNPDCEDQLWEPNKDADTLDIALNPDGSSVDTGIYVKTKPSNAVIDEGFYFTENIYKSFLKDLKDWKADGIMNDYGVLAYDWRLAFPNILNQGDATIDGKVYYDDSFSTSTPYILQEIRKLAQSSDTGKVTIIGHSMGGMLAKKILHDYAYIASSTDTLILVDSPQLGTPQAIATLLHGTNEELDFPVVGWPNFTTEETVRLIAQNMKSVYTLLPSREYAAHVENSGMNHTTLFSQNDNLRNIADDPLWNANSVLDFYQMKYGTTTIATYDGMKDFLGGKDGHVSAPDNDIVHPKRIQMDMLAEAQAIHDEIDNWVPPEKMRVVQIAGWGIPDTIRGIEYKENYHLVCPVNYAGGGGQMPNCTETRKFDVEPMFTFDGDGTVVLPSQIGMATTTETYFVDLNEHNNSLGNSDINFRKNRTHGSVLEVGNVRTLIENIVKKTESPANSLDYIKINKAQLIPEDLDPLIRLSLHSPVKADIYDQYGNHLGLTATTTDTELPNSYYLEMGEGKYLGFQLEASTTIKLQGTGTGTFTLNLEQYQGDTKEGTQTFTDIPVSTTTKATLVINTLNDAKELALDQDGDGTIDSMVFTDENKETVTFQTLKTQIQALTTKTKPVLLIEIAVAEKQFNK
ncbi:MAG: hypothetical protein WCT48_02995, partial [Candidatus Paceibacterota bacterium]